MEKSWHTYSIFMELYIFSKYTRHDPKKQIVSKYNCSHYLINEAGKHIIYNINKESWIKIPKKKNN
jgi:hypothetical protein